VRANRPEANLHDREHFIDLKNLTAIGQAGENLLLELMKESSLHGLGMFTKHC
jgi:anti-anti-sigma regulatory factor